MSLVVWLPLNGDLTNQGLSNVTVTNNGATVDNNGKIGKCYSFNGTNSKISTSIDLTLEMSFCAWVKMNSIANFIIDARNDSGQGYQPMYISSTGVQIYGSGSPSGGYVNYSFSTGVWYHIAVIYSNNKGYLYINGSLIGSIGVASLALSNSKLSIGGRYSNTSYFNGYINDIRIYNHALSAKEVKDLAKGLVLHYRLAGPGQSNLMPNTSNKIQSTNVTTNYNILYSISGSQMEKGAKYVYSGYFENTGTKIIRLRVQWFNSGSDRGGSTSSIDINPGDKGFYCLPFTYTSGTYNTFQLGMDGNSNTAITSSTYNYAFVKLERGSIQTPWCPNPADALYTALGYNNNIEYDCSGYRRNGTKNGSITWDVNSARYATSYKFGANSYICAKDKCRPTDAITVTWWGYLSNWSNYNRAISCTEDGGWNFEPYSSKMSFVLYQAGVGYIRALDSMNLSSLSSGWHHWAATFDKGVIKLYRDGTLVNTYTSSSQNGIQYNTSAGLFIGAEAGGSLTSPESAGTFNGGNLTDIRIYATALSAEDIAELYHSAVIVDNTGKSYAYEYFEAQ